MIKSMGREFFEDPADGEVVFAGEVDAGEELRTRTARNAEAERD